MSVGKLGLVVVNVETVGGIGVDHDTVLSRVARFIPSI